MFRKILRFCEDFWLQVRDGKTNGKNLVHFSNIKLFVLYFGIVDYIHLHRRRRCEIEKISDVFRPLSVKLEHPLAPVKCTVQAEGWFTKENSVLS